LVPEDIRRSRPDYISRALRAADPVRFAPAERAVKSLWDDDHVTPILVRGAVVPATTTGVGWANELAAQAVAAFVSTIAPISGAAQPKAVAQWRRVPANHAIAIETITGIWREILRPDIFAPAVKFRTSDRDF
jgi:hypothetical protein